MIAIRPARETDLAYVAATAGYQIPRFVRGVPRDDIKLAFRALLSASRIVVACSEADVDTLVGWCAAIAGCPWFAFVAREFRAQGIGRRLRREATNDSDQISFGNTRRWENAGLPAGLPGPGDIRLVGPSR